MSEPSPEVRLPASSVLAVPPEQTTDDTDRGWGERPAESDPDDLERFLSDRPPHHGDI